VTITMRGNAKNLITRQLVIQETIAGNFERYPPYKYLSLLHEVQLVRSNSSSPIMEISYSLETDQEVREVIDSCLAVSQLSQVIFGTGFGQCETVMSELREDSLHAVGYLSQTSRARKVSPLFSNENDCFNIFRRIIEVQTNYTSYRRDIIVGALSQIREPFFINSMFAWAWWTLEWFLWGVETKTSGVQGPLSYYIQDSNYQRRKVSKLYVQRNVLE